MNVQQAGRLAVALAAVCGAGAAVGQAAASAQPVAWGTTSSAPAGARGELFGVAAASPGDALAVGGDNPGQPPTQVLTRPYAERWSGAGWTATPVPLARVYPPGEQAAQLNGVTEAAPGDGWAVGTVSDTSSLASQTLAYHWNGAAWIRSPAPDPAGPAQPNQLNAVAARAANDVWAVGGDGYPAASLVLHWNDGLTGVTATGSTVLATSGDEVLRLSLTGAAAQVTPAVDPLVLSTIAADPAGNPWAAGWTAARGKVGPAIINAPGIGQGGIIVTTGAATATVTWSGPATGAGSTGLTGRFAVGGLPDGRYTVIASLAGCPPRTATAEVSAGLATAVKAHITCPS